MKNIFTSKIKVIFIAGLAVTALAAPFYGSALADAYEKSGGALRKDAITGEVTYIPDTFTGNSGATFGNSPAYDPGYAAPDNLPSDTADGSIDNAEIKVPSAEEVEMTTEFSEYDKGVKEIRFTITNNSDYDLCGGLFFRLLKYENEQWEPVSLKGEVLINALAWVIEPHKSMSRTLDLDKYYKLPLSAGLYRIVEGNKTDIYAEFTVK